MILDTNHTTYAFIHEPGNATSYRLVVTFDASNNIKCIAWPDMRWSVGDFGSSVSAEWLHSQGKLRSKVDARAIADIVNHLASCRRRNT